MTDDMAHNIPDPWPHLTYHNNDTELTYLWSWNVGVTGCECILPRLTWWGLSDDGQYEVMNIILGVDLFAHLEYPLKPPTLLIGLNGMNKEVYIVFMYLFMLFCMLPDWKTLLHGHQQNPKSQNLISLRFLPGSGSNTRWHFCEPMGTTASCIVAPPRECYWELTTKAALVVQ